MLYKQTSDPPQIRYRCRNPRCTAKLKTPAENRRDAFCRKACETAFYRVRCRVCENLFSRKTPRRQVCSRSKCRHDFQRFPERYFGARYPSSPLGHNSEKTSIESNLKTGLKSGRAFRQVAGPELDATTFRCATVGADCIPVAAANLAFLKYRRDAARKAIFQRDTPPLNVIGGYRFPGAPVIDLTPIAPPEPTPPIPTSAATVIGSDPLDIPEFLKR